MICRIPFAVSLAPRGREVNYTIPYRPGDMMMHTRAGTILPLIVCATCGITRCAAWRLSVAIQPRISWVRKSTTPISMSDHHHDTGSHPKLTRTELLRGVSAVASTAAATAVAAIFGAEEPARAALPTPDDYAFGTGSQVSSCLVLFMRHVHFMSTSSTFDGRSGPGEDDYFVHG